MIKKYIISALIISIIILPNTANSANQKEYYPDGTLK